MRPVSVLIAGLVLVAPFTAPAFAAGGSDALHATAAKEQLMLTDAFADGPGRFVVRLGGALTKDAFVRGASLLAYALYAERPALREIVFEHAFASKNQRCVIAEPDLQAYLADQIDKPAYHQRLTYAAWADTPKALAPFPKPSAAGMASGPSRGPGSTDHAAVDWPAEPNVGLPGFPAIAPTRPALPVPPRPRPAGLPALAPESSAAASAPALSLPRFGGDFGASWAMGLGKSGYDAFAFEYGHALLPTLEVRPSLWIISNFSPIAQMGGGARFEGFSGALDLMGTTRNQVGLNGLALEGGIGVRSALLRGAELAGGVWPASHLRVGARWQALVLAMRYPLLGRTGDPTATTTSATASSTGTTDGGPLTGRPRAR